MSQQKDLERLDSVPEFTPPRDVPKKKKRRGVLALKVFVVALIVLVSTGFLFSYKVLSVGKDIFVDFGEKRTSVLDQLSRLAFSENKPVAGEEDGRTNILLLGMGGEGHTGAELTDTIMIASIKHNPDSKEKEVALFSIPRDLYVANSQGGKQKINSIYAGASRTGGEVEGAKAISEVVSEVMGLPIHYYIRVDFEGFRKVVDTIGGVEVDVDRGFVDSRYPTYDFGYQTVEFEKGLQTMDGERALIYSRSRHGVVTDGEGSEGSDFARAQRQQKVLEAVKSKALSAGTIFNPKKINEMIDVLGDHVRTNIQPWEISSFVEMAKVVENDAVINKVIDNAGSGLLYSSNAGGAYILLPVGGDYSKIQHLAKNVFFIGKIESESTNVMVLNGTTKAGLARNIASKVENLSLSVSGVGNTIDSDYSKTTIYTLGTSPISTELLSKSLDATVVSSSREEVAELTTSAIPQETTVVVVAGKDSVSN